jgi:surface protein
MMVSKLQRSDADIHIAVDAWCDNPVKATIKYGHISKWNKSLVTNMKKLFQDKTKFNDDISKWNVKNVTDMSDMFSIKFGSTGSFTVNITRWNVSSVTNMECMFRLCPIAEKHKPKS